MMAWWQNREDWITWRELEEPRALAEHALELLACEKDPLPWLRMGRDTIKRLLDDYETPRRDRRAKLERLWHAHGPESLSPMHSAAIPNLLWEHLLMRIQPGVKASARSWLTAPGRQYHLGVENRLCQEFWVHPLASGASYNGRLWVWGTARAVASLDDPAPAELQALSPRLAWQPLAGGWQPHPLLRRAVAKSSLPVGARPRIDDGPGYLLACIVDAIVELVGAVPTIEPREIAVLWGTMLLPLLAPSVIIMPDAVPTQVADDGHGEPEYLHTLPFFFLHPRLQTLIVIIDHVATLLVADDWTVLGEFLEHLQGDEWVQTDDPVAIEAVLTSWLQRFMRPPYKRSARVSWNSGFGYRLSRDILRRALNGNEAQAMAVDWDRLVNANIGASVDKRGHLAHRLREALGTALCFKGRPRHPDGPVVRGLIDRVWSRWTNPLFLS